MRNCSLNFGLISAACSVYLLSGCSSHVEAPQVDSSRDLQTSAAVPKSLRSNAINQSEIDLEQEANIERLCLAAWRKCIAGKHKEAISELKALSKQYPQSSSVLFMTGQVLDKCGKKKEAAAYYEKASHDSDFAVMSLFKLAEHLRITGDTNKAIDRYEELVSIAPQFTQAHIGLAKALMKQNPKSTKAISEIKLALTIEPDNKEAKALLAH